MPIGMRKKLEALKIDDILSNMKILPWILGKLLNILACILDQS